MTIRKHINTDIEADVLFESKRRCCICFGLYRDLDVKAGQIAHLDKDNSNNKYDNLAFLCLPHHDQYDSRTSQSKNFTIKEVKKYRNELKGNLLTINKPKTKTHIIDKNSVDDYKKEEIRKVLIEILKESGSITHFMPISHKTGLSKNVIENSLIELSKENKIRIDREKGSLKRTYSLSDSNENLIIDAYLKTFGDSIIDEQRYIRKNNFEIDALVKTTNEEFVIEVKMAKYLNPNSIKSTIKRITTCRKELNIPDKAKTVLLIGLNDSTIKLNDSLKEVENTGVIVKFIEVNK